MLCSWVDPRLCRANLYWIDTTLLLWLTFFVWISLQDCLWFLWPQWPGQCFPSNKWRSCDNAWKEPSSQRGLAIGRQTPSACHKTWHICFLSLCSHNNFRISSTCISVFMMLELVWKYKRIQSRIHQVLRDTASCWKLKPRLWSSSQGSSGEKHNADIPVALFPSL